MLKNVLVKFNIKWPKRFFVQGGFSIVEVLVASGIFLLVITTLLGSYVYGQRLTAQAGLRSRAVFLAEEGLEAVRNIRDEDFAKLNNGAYGLTISNPVKNWTLAADTPDTTDVFTRQVDISTVDANTKYVASTVTWPQNNPSIGTVSLATYLTNWQRQTIGDWSGPSKSCVLLADARKVQIAGNHAFVIRQGSSPSLSSIDISDPAAPHFVSELALSNGSPQNIYISGSRAYIASANNNAELQIVNINNPANMQLIGAYNAPEQYDAKGVYAIGTTVYFVRDESRNDAEFYIINAANPAAPQKVGSLKLATGTNEIAVMGNYAYIASASNTEELTVVNITNPAAPAKIGSYNLTGNADALTIAGFGNTVLLGRADGIMYIFNVATPSSPLLLGSYNANGSVNDIALGIDILYAFLATNSTGRQFQVINFSNPASPLLVGYSNMSVEQFGVAYDAETDISIVVGGSNTKPSCVIVPK